MNLYLYSLITLQLFSPLAFCWQFYVHILFASQTLNSLYNQFYIAFTLVYIICDWKLIYWEIIFCPTVTFPVS